jgi:hypothetical protein
MTRAGVDVELGDVLFDTEPIALSPLPSEAFAVIASATDSLNT